MELFGNLGTGDQPTVYNVVGPLLLVVLVFGAVVIHGVSGSIWSEIRNQFLIALLRGWRLWWRLFLAPFVGTAREMRAAYREFRAVDEPSTQWTAGLGDRARRRTGAVQSDSAELIREGRETREWRD